MAAVGGGHGGGGGRGGDSQGQAPGTLYLHLHHHALAQVSGGQLDRKGVYFQAHDQGPGRKSYSPNKTFI